MLLILNSFKNIKEEWRKGKIEDLNGRSERKSNIKKTEKKKKKREMLKCVYITVKKR